MSDLTNQPNETPTRWRRIAKRVAIILGLYLVLAFIAFVAWLPNHPQSRAGWIAFFVLAPPLYLLFEWLGDLYGRPWWESSPWLKVLKAVLLVIFVLIVLLVSVVFGSR